MSIMKPLMQPLVDRRDPHWDKVVALLHFDGDLNNEAGVSWQAGTQTSFAAGKFNLGLNFTKDRNQMARAPISNDFVFGSEDFTIEVYAKPSAYPASGAYPSVIAKRNGFSDRSFDMHLMPNTNRWRFGIRFSDGTTVNLDSQNPATLNEFTMIAAVRQGGTAYLFIDGNLERTITGLGTKSLANTSARVAIGQIDIDSSSNTGVWNGVIDELRITKGVARYTKNFTPPKKPFPNK